MNEYENLLQHHAAPLLGPDERVEAIASLYSGDWSQKYFIAGATNQRIVLVEVTAGLLGPKPIFAGVREIHYTAIESLNTSAFFNQKSISIVLRPGQFLRFGLNTLHRIVPGQKRFICTLGGLYRQFKLAADALPTSISVPESVDLHALEDARAHLRLNQNFGLGILAGALASVAAAVVWAAITVVTGYQISWMAIGIGLLVGTAVRVFGRGVDKYFGIAAAILSLAGCVLGNFLWAAYFFAQGAELPLLDALALLTRIPTIALELMTITFNIKDIIFYAIAAVSGYALAFQSPRPATYPPPTVNV
jgi:hypothetical protein